MAPDQPLLHVGLAGQEKSSTAPSPLPNLITSAREAFPHSKYNQGPGPPGINIKHVDRSYTLQCRSSLVTNCVWCYVRPNALVSLDLTVTMNSGRPAP